MIAEKLQFDFSKYDNINTFAESDEMFWNDLTIQVSSWDGIARIYDAHSGEWYEIENKYTYANITYLIDNDYNVTFWLVTDSELIQQLNEEL